MTTLPIPVSPAFRIIAHRGASAYVPENTLAAFELAQAMGVTEIETDVRL
ncbi:MAG: glycerophosphodiester phosphodiesterase, partial [Caldilineaceae bacterium]|nr:glycerophosphodiester phosphodiesterase [Caldilineaceae bacterium]